MSDKDNEKELSANPEDLGLREPGAGDDGGGGFRVVACLPMKGAEA